MSHYGSQSNGFRNKLRELDIVFNEENILCLTSKDIPISVKFIASFGPKFGIVNMNGDNLPFFKFEIAWEKILEESNEFGQNKLIKADFSILREDMKHNLSCKATKAQIFIRHQADLAERFLERNADIVVAPADKGGKIIIMDRELLEAKTQEYLEAGLKDHTYFYWKDGSVEDCRKILEPKFERLREALNPLLMADVEAGKSNTCSQIECEPYMIAKFTVLLKAHKEGNPPRPIVAAPDAWCKSLSNWILKKLELISNSFNRVTVKSSEDFVQRLRELPALPSQHEMVNWDYESMFTNIPLGYTKKMISTNYGLIQQETCVPVDIFLEAISLLVEDSSYFLYRGKVYRQTRGLTMGNRLSKILAEIITNFLTLRSMESLQSNHFSFLNKFVDDFVSAMDPKVFDEFEQGITADINSLKVKRSGQSSDGSITFLDVEIIRDNENNILTQWWQKECSARHILNYHSAHPKYMKENVVLEYIRHALSVTSPVLFNDTIKRLKKNLRRSSYPISFVQDLINRTLAKYGTVSVLSTIGEVDSNFDISKEIDMRNREGFAHNNGILVTRKDCNKKDCNKKFISIPYVTNGSFERTREIVKKRRIDCDLAPCMTRTNRYKIFSKIKDKTEHTGVRFGIFKLVCGECGFGRYFRTNNLDVGRTVKHVMLNKKSIMNEHIRKFPDHKILSTPRKVMSFNNRTDLRIAFENISRNGNR